MTGILNAVASRVKYLAVCLNANVDRDATMKLAEQNKKLILKLVSDYPRELSLDAAGAMIRCISQDLEMFSPECRQELIDCINSKTSRNDMQPSDNIDEQQAAAVPELVRQAKQKLYYIENYLTNGIWRRLIAVQVNRESVYLDIAKLLIKLGLSRPEEKFWGHLVGFIQWANDVPMDNPSDDIDLLKAMWNEAKFSAPLHCEPPIAYPRYPSMLMDTHPGIYRQAYGGNEHPAPPPSKKDMHSISVLKATPVCRNTKVTVYQDPCNMMLQRHHLALETMLVLGKLCPQCRPGELY